ncbi:dTDP-4-dehydrorhamnose 3,5-epimerase [Flexilinea flocculi]|uniref:dTDP-4-dehydrorhamnose 3,5-epimerase n=1 Tax=Flexilinea flocculi TaxID=1678840 RepID=A0A0K8PAC7_9CHLR|nr:dTDP-4-dehydrorhamnose 3,5-epimerase [Flexilinea flocculi]GAP39474.1 dTDP-4-dehydrorhamnose 3,5-epimerase [Flexilinea flocculi]
MMQKFEFKETEIAGLIEVQPFYADDGRGYFLKDYSKEIFEQNGIEYDLKEVFYTNSYKGVIRALHFQREKQQPKLIRCVLGKVFDVVVDLRKDSPTFKKWLNFELNEENKRELLIPAGCAHGYLVLEQSIMSYKCAEKFYGEYDDGIMWNDPNIGIKWPLELVDYQIILAEKDKNLQTFSMFMETYGGF